DALAVGIKAHGDAAYAMNARVMYPVFDILDAAEAYAFAGSEGMAEKIGHTNYRKVFHDEEITARRHAWEDYLTTEKATDFSAQTTPRQFTTSKDNPLLTQTSGKPVFKKPPFKKPPFKKPPLETEKAEKTEEVEGPGGIVGVGGVFGGES